MLHAGIDRPDGVEDPPLIDSLPHFKKMIEKPKTDIVPCDIPERFLLKYPDQGVA